MGSVPMFHKQHVWGLTYVDELLQVGINQDPDNAALTGNNFENDCERFFWALQDANYNVLGLVSATGDLVERYEYTPYGRRTVFSRGWLLADMNDDGLVNDDDEDIWDAVKFTYTSASRADLNGDGQIDASDHTIWNSNNNTSIIDDPLVMQPRLESFRNTERSMGAETTNICNIGHQGLMHDKEFGLIYNRARYLSPKLGRFLQRDPLGYVDGMSLYEYVQSGPLGRLDPMGTDIIPLRPLDYDPDDPITRLREEFPAPPPFAGQPPAQPGPKAGPVAIQVADPSGVLGDIADATTRLPQLAGNALDAVLDRIPLVIYSLHEHWYTTSKIYQTARRQPSWPKVVNTDRPLGAFVQGTVQDVLYGLAKRNGRCWVVLKHVFAKADMHMPSRKAYEKGKTPFSWSQYAEFVETHRGNYYWLYHHRSPATESYDGLVVHEKRHVQQQYNAIRAVAAEYARKRNFAVRFRDVDSFVTPKEATGRLRRKNAVARRKEETEDLQSLMAFQLKETYPAEKHRMFAHKDFPPVRIPGDEIDAVKAEIEYLDKQYRIWKSKQN